MAKNKRLISAYIIAIHIRVFYIKNVDGLAVLYLHWCTDLLYRVVIMDIL